MVSGKDMQSQHDTVTLLGMFLHMPWLYAHGCGIANFNL